MSEPKILEFLNDAEIKISSGSISNIILKVGKEQASERDDIKNAGLSVSECVNTDTTGCVENGVDMQNHNFNSECFSVFYTTSDRKRTTIIDILRDFRPRVFAFNEEFFSLVTMKNISESKIDCLKHYANESLRTEEEIQKILSVFPETTASLLYDLSYISGYHAEEGYPIVNILLTDDASVYDLISFIHALCWIHEGRHFKKLNPTFTIFREALDNFLTQFWNFYHALVDFKLNPSTEYAVLLEKKFDSLFTLVTVYDELNERIKITYQKKDELLVVLKNPSIPLHNNGSELEVRKTTRHRDISFQTKCKEGTLTRDVIFSIMSTCNKLGVNFYQYLLDRISKKFDMPSLASLIRNLHPT